MDDPTDFFRTLQAGAPLRADADRLAAAIDTADPEQLLALLQTALAIRGRVSPELFWRLVRRIAVKLLIVFPKDPTEARP